ncbi:MAG: LamG-like jellyroll fold domain-containing protein, partial [Candidatus Hodarchaeota archaeon]
RENPEGVWDPNYKAIWHLSEDPTGTTYDSTSNDKDGTSSGSMTSNDQITGKINGALDFDGTDDTISFGSWMPSTDFNPSSGTISFWITRQFLDSVSENKMVLQIRESGTNRIMFRYDGGDYEWRFHHEGNNIQTIKYVPADEIPRLEWIYVVQTWDVNSDFIKGYINGSLYGSSSGLAHPTNGSYNIYLASDRNGGEYFYGSIDEVRFSDIYRTDEWIETEYNNQNDPQSFLTLGPEESFDIAPPTYSNLIESSDPLELGNTEVISINVFDPSGINQVKIEFTSINHSMTNISGDTWQYDTWTPDTVGNYSYTIWMEDNCNNWNSTIGSIEVIDTTPPTYSDLIESADPLHLGQNETISIKVYDSPGSGVNQVLLEYEFSNHTMSLESGKWSWSKWKPNSTAIYPYKIYMEDMENNWNETSGTVTVISTYAPVIENLTRSEDPLELGNIITINVDIVDNETYVFDVLIELEGNNYTMASIGGNTYEYNWTRFSVGIVYFTIYACDNESNWNSYSDSFDIIDTTPPVIDNLTISEDPLEFGDTVVIAINSTDLANINQALIEYEDSDHVRSNHTMTNIVGDIWQHDSWTPGPTVGNWSYTIYVEDNNYNWAFISNSILVQDTTPPIYSDLTESAKIVELGDQLTISINATDLADIKVVSIEFENSNHTMTKLSPDMDIWQYNSWAPTSIGNYTYTIYIKDNNDNLNYVVSSILFQDTKVPVYSNLFESADPLELGNNPIVRINIYDFAGINQAFIEFEGANHSMTNIYGNTWQYDSWTPTNWIVYQYKIHMEDKSSNWKSLISNITVQDTTPPPIPILANSPSGDVSGSLVFDWSDGFDPSGILYYILIIDNETDPTITPGYVYRINITNTGSESSYHELSEVLHVGRYYFFLAQIDGLGHQSSYTMGTFTVIAPMDGNTGNFNIIMIVIIIATVGASATALFIVRKKFKKNISPPRQKISFKIITSHLNKLSSSHIPFRAEEIQGFTPTGTQDQFITSKELKDEKELGDLINEFKINGEELFAEGAYLEAQKQFFHAKDLLLGLGRDEEANILSELISGISELIEEREKRLEVLEQVKIEGDPVKIYEKFYDIIEISKKLRDYDGVSIYKSELIHYFQNNMSKLINIENYRNNLEQKAESLIENNIFEIAAQLYEKCENISQLFVQLGREEEIVYIDEFRSKKEECLKKI